MYTKPLREEHGAQARPRGTAALWGAAAAVAAFGTWVLYDGLPGINWVLWVGTATAGLLARRGGVAPPLVATGVGATVIAGAAAITANPFMHTGICAAVILFLAMQMLLSAGPSLKRIGALFAVTAPFRAFVTATVRSFALAVEATSLVRSTRARAGVRGLAITLPVLLVFALLLSAADPVFAAWRESVSDLLSSWEFLPRILLFLGLLGIVLGAYDYAARAPDAEAASGPEPAPCRLLGSTEGVILLAGVAGLFWLFLAVQVSYLFGTLPRVPGSGITFAEYARRGFGELTVVVSASTLLVVLSERYGEKSGRERALRLLTFAVIVAVLFLLASAFYRVLLYEEAYGFTTARLYGQTYMLAVALGLTALFREVAGNFDPGRLFRRTAVATTLLFIVLAYWNHEAWIAHRNLDRFAASGELDVTYLACELSPGAIPAIVRSLPSLPEPTRSELRKAILARYAGRPRLFERKWFEWNLGRERARESLTTSLGLHPGSGFSRR